MRVRERCRTSLARWWGVGLLCGAIVTSMLVDRLPLLPV